MTQYRCYGRLRPRIPRGVSIGCPDNNWPIAWRKVGGLPTPGPLFADFASEGLVFSDIYTHTHSVACRWTWHDPLFSGPNVTLDIYATNSSQTAIRREIIVTNGGFILGRYVWNGAWENSPFFVLPYNSGAMAGWTNKEFSFVLEGKTYQELPPDFCLPGR